MDVVAAPDEKNPLKVEAPDGRPEVLIEASSDDVPADLMNVPSAWQPEQLTADEEQ